jgi:tetratricopeptide (TPR) repeat protein
MKLLTRICLVFLSISASSNGFTLEPENSSQNIRLTLPTSSAPTITPQTQLKALNILIKRRQYKQAFSLANRLLETYEGEPKFDFQFGMAAVETGHYDAALFAFERLVFTYPNQARYRLELARTHFYLRNLKRAELEFKKIIKLNPPIAVKKNIELFLGKITELNRMTEPRLLLTIDLGSGYDSNINSATNERELPKEELVFPVDIVLNDESRETGSSYWNTLINFGYLSPLSKTSSYDIRTVYSKRANTQVTSYNLDTAMLEAGYGFYIDAIKWRGAGRYQKILLDGESFLNTSSFIGQATWQMKSSASLNFSMNYGMSSYDANPDGDMTLQQFNITYSAPVKKDNWFFTFIFGSDSADNSLYKFNEKNYQGFTYYSSTFLGQRASRYWMVNVVSSKYGAINSTLFSKLRKDTSITTGIGWRYSFNSKFSFRNDYSATLSNSSLKANTYNRYKTEFGLTYSF